MTVLVILHKRMGNMMDGPILQPSPTVTKLQIAEFSLKRKVHDFEVKTLT